MAPLKHRVYTGQVEGTVVATNWINDIHDDHSKPAQVYPRTSKCGQMVFH